MSNDGTIDVSLSSDTVSRQYSLNNGSSWSNGSGTSFLLPEGTYDTTGILVKDYVAAGNVAQTAFVFLPQVMLEATGVTNRHDNNPQITAVGTSGAYVVTKELTAAEILPSSCRSSMPMVRFTP